ncbi:tRNA G18 (ribose-2'-O)-methylase SpoU [Kocuria rhizophila]|uniref:TrmH family RNA methyltransferase n=1 Tax=Kocuria TaxID=57493 RepID=UPI000E9A27F7|nr:MULTISPECIES: RNA methyltransferase [Kocuria]HBH56091.1 rRNA methyltransferase [Kocuria sp.]
MTSPAPLSERIVELSDPADPRVADYTSLTDVSLRRKLEPERGLYLAESSKVLRRALDAGHRPRSFFMAEKWLDGLRDVLEAHDVPVYVGADEVLEQITGFHLHRGAMAAMHRPEPLPLESVLASARRVAILEDIVDHTNVGALIRSAAAMGVDAVLVTPRCADPLYRRAIRVSMGTVFQVPWTRIDPWPESIDTLQDAGFVVAGMTLGEGAITLDELVAEDYEKLALVFGSEGPGLTQATEQRLDRRVTIPMMGGVDSLNVAAASALALYATRLRHKR